MTPIALIPPYGRAGPGYKLHCKVSRTASDGKSTGVLSAWQLPRSYHSLAIKYELWNHDSSLVTKVSEIDIPLEHHPKDYQMRINPMAERYPLSISPDLSSFAILDRLFKIIPTSDTTPMYTLSTKVPFAHRKMPNDPHTDFFEFGSQGNFFLSSDATEWARECARITIYEVEDEGTLQIKPLNHIHLKQRGFLSLIEAVFHPIHYVVVVRGRNWVAVWNFVNEYESSFALLMSGQDVGSVTISPCGKYVVYQNPERIQRRIIDIPRDLLTANATSSIRPSSTLLPALTRHQTTINSLVSTRQDAHALQLSPGCSVQQNQVVTKTDGKPAQLISVEGGHEIAITKANLSSRSVDEAINIIQLPKWQGMHSATPTVVTLALGDDSIRVIVGENARDTCQRRQVPNGFPLFISPPISAVKHTLSKDHQLPQGSEEQQGNVEKVITDRTVGWELDCERARKKRKVETKTFSNRQDERESLREGED